jgi:hypothetical protein
VQACKALPSFTPPFVAHAASKEEGLGPFDCALYSALGKAVSLWTPWRGDVVWDAKLSQRKGNFFTPVAVRQKLYLCR